MKFPLLLLAVAFALAFAYPMRAEEKSEAPADLDRAWSKVAIEKRDHAPLLERQAKLPVQLAKNPVAITVFVLDPNLIGLITAVATA